MMKVSNTGFRTSISFWLNVWLQILILLAIWLILIYGSETDLSGLVVKKLMH